MVVPPFPFEIGGCCCSGSEAKGLPVSPLLDSWLLPMLLELVVVKEGVVAVVGVLVDEVDAELLEAEE